MAKPKRFALFGIVMVLVVTMLFSMFNANAFGAQAVADDSTLSKWTDTGDNTKNIGRIWTDKSVSTDKVTLPAAPGGEEIIINKDYTNEEGKTVQSDFLVSLSALSSAGSIKGETVSTKPLDIVLVLDTSRSMSYDSGGYTYVPTYDVRENGETTYYAEVDGEYVEVERITTGLFITMFDRWEVNGQTVKPKTNANDNTEGRIQFYIRKSNSKMEALQNVAKDFIDSTEDANKAISDVNKQHRISLVTFASSASTRQELTVCDTNNAISMKQIINGLRANGGTQADDGMRQAQSALSGAREDAQKVVIFFTDGEPGDYGFTDSVANGAINTAKTLKSGENGALIYSIGMFSDADPENTTEKFNAYMHGVSSNYPKATSYTNLGDRATNTDGTQTTYYKKASDSAELNKVFDEIFKDISKIEASSPFEDGTGLNGENMEAVTFHDELGDYMKVDGFKSIVFADKVFKNPTILKKPIEGEDKEIIQYTFEGIVDTGNTVYPEGNLNKIIITVERYNDPAKGDVVTVTIPASMIPLCEYVVDTTGEKKMTIDDTFPLRIFYGASLKAEAKDLLANPDEAMQNYIKANKTDEGQVHFYSNKYYKNGTNNGGVYVEFTPNKTNDFYYFQENERLFLDEECTQPATGALDTSGSTIYYYNRLYYAMENGKPVEQHNIVEIPGNSNIVLAGFVASDAEGLYIPSGTPRTTSLSTHTLYKEENITNTATYVTAPDWDNVHNPKNVIVKLGNNGLLPIDLPGTLEVTKKVTADAGLTAPADAEFDFTLDLTAPTNGSLKDSYRAQKFDKNNGSVGGEFTIADNGTFKLKADQTVRIYGLEDGVDYKVTEAEHKGFTTTATGDSGDIIKNQTATAAFTNNYSTTHATFAGINVQKTLPAERGWKDGDKFSFKLEGNNQYEATMDAIEAGNVVLPDPATVEITKDDKDHTKAFGEITFKQAGEYSFKVTEVVPQDDDKIPGIVYNTESKIVNVVVTDNDNGELVAKVKTGDTTTADSTTVTIANTYVPANAEPVETTGLFTKVIDGRDWLDTDSFTFTIAPQDGAPEPENTTATVTKEDVKDGKAAFDFGTIEFTANHMKDANENNGVKSKKFTYTVKEDNAGKTENGLTYSENVATMTITVTDDGTGKLTASATVASGEFKNVYSTTLDYKAKVGLDITKVLNGRDMEAEQFEFTVKPANKDSADKLGIPENGTVVKSNAAKMGVKATMPIDLNKAEVFTQKDAGKIYSYTVTETKGGVGGYTNDDKPVTVTITTAHDPATAGLTVTTSVTKDRQKISETTVNAADDKQTVSIPFENTYNGGTGTLGGDGNVKINATKSLTGRELKADEFSFVVKNGDEQVVTGKNAANGNITFEAIGYDIEKLEKDVAAGKATAVKTAGGAYVYTYSYTVAEDTSNLPAGVTPVTTSPFTITVTVTDDGKGSPLDVKVIYPTGATGLEFENNYGEGAETAEINLNGQKVLTTLSGNNAPDITGKYTFKLTATGGTPMPQTTEAKNDKSGNISFGKIKYTMKDVFGNEGSGVRTKVFTYTVTETGGLDGIANDEPQTFKVTVKDNGDGTITATTDNGTDPLFKFVNKYSVDEITSSVTDTINIKKNLDGDREMKAGEFQFELVERISEGDNVVDKVIDRAANDADGNVKFGAIKYDNVGTHEYTVREVNNGLGGITYDTNSYKIVTNVTDNGDGTLAVNYEQESIGGDNGKTIVFKNTYKTNPTSVILGATKILKNGELKDGQFTFLLKDSKGDVVSEAKNDAKGSIRFDTMEFDKAGTFEYTVSEAEGNDKNIRYDDTEYKITIEVKDDGSGNMTAEITKGAENGITFVNAVEAGAGTKTGDNTPLAALAVVMMAATGAGIVTVRRKIKH